MVVCPQAHGKPRWGANGADDRARTGDLDLGKVALYQLSYVRVNIHISRHVVVDQPTSVSVSHQKRCLVQYVVAKDGEVGHRFSTAEETKLQVLFETEHRDVE
jgi:hypothetical protein